MYGPLPKSRNSPPEPFDYAPPEPAPLEVIHQDRSILVLNKPSGLLSVVGKHPAHADCLEARVRKEFPAACTVHRLDRETSGIMIFALDAASHRHLGQQFERRMVEKTYHARVHGNPSQDSGTIDLPICTDWPNRPKQMVEKMLGRQAITHWKVIERSRSACLMELHPKTGRSHQLRVHMLELGHPILGDTFYAPPEARRAASRLMLHAQSIRFRHPDGGQWLSFQSPRPF